MQQWQLLYRASLVLLLAVFVGLLVVTPIDTILQSQSSGQFWNVIIIVVAYALTVVIAVVLYTSRLFRTRRALSLIPRRYIPQRDDVTKDSGQLIEKELDRCMQIVNETLPKDQKISHPGLMHPKLSNGQFDAPYDQVVDTMNFFIEYKTKVLFPHCERPSGMPMREYMYWMLEQGIITSEHVVEEFIQVYETTRFSGRLITEQQFDEYIELCVKVLFAIHEPESSENPDQISDQQQQQQQDLLTVPLVDPFGSQARLNPLTTFSTRLSPFASRMSNQSSQSVDNTSVIVRRRSNNNY